MNRFVCAILLALVSASTGMSQDADTPTISRTLPSTQLPESWHGRWAGKITNRSLDGNSTEFQMELRIAPIETQGLLNWTIVYRGDQGQSERHYLLKPVSDKPNRFVIDEQNGILLDASLLGNSLSTHFQLGESILWSSYRLETSEHMPTIAFELFSGRAGEATKSGGKDGIPNVESLQVGSRQFGILNRVDNREETPRTAGIATWTKLATEAYRGKQDDIYFVTSMIGWYVNGAGKIFRTDDGGDTWVEQLHQPGTYFRCIAFVDELNGFAGNIGPGYFPNVSDSVPLYETRDGGTTWTPVTTIEGPQVTGLCALQVLNEPFVNAGQLETRTRLIGVGRVGGPTAMIVSDDLGRTWQQIDISDHAAMAFDVHFFNRNEGLIAAASHADVSQSSALVLSTSDGGKTWDKAWQSGRPYELTWKFSFPTRETGYVTIQSYNPDPNVVDRFVGKTIDGGKSWSEIPLIRDARVREFGIGFLNETTGWLGAVPNGFQTTDGGATWSPAEIGNAVNKIRILKTPEGNVGFAIGVEVHRLEMKD